VKWYSFKANNTDKWEVIFQGGYKCPFICKYVTVRAIGENTQNGTYLLRIKLDKSQTISFGRFDGGRKIEVIAGEYFYIGSALARRGATSLGNRLQRHCRKTPGKEDHRILHELRSYFDSVGLKYTRSPSPKKLFWNIDHLLDLDDAEVIGVIFARNPVPLENNWSKFLEESGRTSIFAKGLGANDSRGHTHVQRFDEPDEIWWEQLPALLPK